MGLIIRWLISAIALVITVKIGEAIGLPMSIKLGAAPFVAVLILAIVNALIRPIVRLLTLPLNCLTFGLFGVVINALLFWLAGSPWLAGRYGFEIKSFLAALFGSVAMGLVGGLLNSLVRKEE